MKIIKYISFIALFFILSCQKENIPAGQVSDSLWLEHKGAQMPILVEGNIDSKTLLLILHGGPGGTAKGYNRGVLDISEPLEERYAVAYYDQRLAGNTKGHYEETTVTVAQMVEDLDLVVDLLRNQYGADLEIFFVGISWGGYLGNAYLATGNNQNKVKGWIDVAGAHNIEKMTIDGAELMKAVAEQQINLNSENREPWQNTIEFFNKFNEELLNNKEPLDEEMSLEQNSEAFTALKIAEWDGLIASTIPDNSEFGAFFFKDDNPLTGLSNKFLVGGTMLWKEALAAPLTEDLKKITIPSLMIWGKYDFVVAPSLGVEMMEKLGTPDEDKSLIIFEQSGHSPNISETDKFVDAVVNFVESYK